MSLHLGWSLLGSNNFCADHHSSCWFILDFKDFSPAPVFFYFFITIAKQWQLLLWKVPWIHWRRGHPRLLSRAVPQPWLSPAVPTPNPEHFTVAPGRQHQAGEEMELQQTLGWDGSCQNMPFGPHYPAIYIETLTASQNFVSNLCQD